MKTYGPIRTGDKLPERVEPSVAAMFDCLVHVWGPLTVCELEETDLGYQQTVGTSDGPYRWQIKTDDRRSIVIADAAFIAGAPGSSLTVAIMRTVRMTARGLEILELNDGETKPVLGPLDAEKLARCHRFGYLPNGWPYHQMCQLY
jgi:hypothetical protein